MNIFPLKDPKPDINYFIDYVKGNAPFKKVLFGELKVDDDLLKVIYEQLFNGKWIERQRIDLNKRRQYWDNVIHIYKHLGYDFVRVSRAISFEAKSRQTQDTGESAQGNRNWSETEIGLISDQESFEKYPWPTVDDIDLFDFEYVNKALPEGMGMFVCPSVGILEAVSEKLVGFTNLSYLSFDNPELLKKIFDKVGDLLYGVYEKIVGFDKCYGFFQGDDWGFKTGLLFSPDFLREYVIPWHQKVAQLAHKHNKIYILHSCGNLRDVGDDITKVIKTDIKHSYEDSAWSVKDYISQYKDDICVMGGVDMDKLVRMNLEELEIYIKDILDYAIPQTRYILGSGNSVTNYTPVENYIKMLEVGYTYNKEEE